MEESTSTGDGIKYRPQPVDDLQIAFPARVDVFLPPWDQIPDEFKDLNRGTRWNKVFSDWFYAEAKIGRLPQEHGEIVAHLQVTAPHLARALTKERLALMQEIAHTYGLLAAAVRLAEKVQWLLLDSAIISADETLGCTGCGGELDDEGNPTQHHGGCPVGEVQSALTAYLEAAKA